MDYIQDTSELTQRFFSYLSANFSNVQASAGLSVKEHPETRIRGVSLSYRGGVHFMGFEGPTDGLSFVLRTRLRENITEELEKKVSAKVGELKGAQRRAYDAFFGKPGFSVKPITLAINVPGYETIVEAPFTFPKREDWTLEVSAFPNTLGLFLNPANEIAFIKSRARST